MSQFAPTSAHPAYRAGAVAMGLAILAILAALAIEMLGGYAPCPLCLEQRYAYYAGIPGLFLALILIAAEYRKAAAWLFFAIALGFLANAGLGTYHAGIEWKFWPGPDTCSNAVQPLSTAPGGILKQLETARVVRCDSAALHISGLSLAAWNAIASFVAFALSLKAAFASVER